MIKYIFTCLLITKTSVRSRVSPTLRSGDWWFVNKYLPIYLNIRFFICLHKRFDECLSLYFNKERYKYIINEIYLYINNKRYACTYK